MNNNLIILPILGLMLAAAIYSQEKSAFENITNQYQVNKSCPYNETNGVQVVRGPSGKLPFSTISNQPNIQYNLLKSNVI